jgi:uncharacterized protein involved in exopolysaccharide biosynthesis
MPRAPELIVRTNSASDIDLRAIGAALRRRRRAIVVPTLLAFILVAVFVNVVTPRYTAETEVLLENQETFFTRPDRSNLQPDQVGLLDPEAVASQVQLISSRDIARHAITQLHLAGNPEFDPLARGLSPVEQVLVLLGVVEDPTRESVESRIITKFLEKLNVFPQPKSRVIAIQFTSRDPDFAALASDTVAKLYLQEQSAAKRATARVSAESLSAQIADLRVRLATADQEREQYRLRSGLLAGSNNMTISGQQLADINGDLSKARTTQADALAKASMIRELLRDGKAADVTDVVNNDMVRRVFDQRVAAQALLARESRTLLPGHPRIKELNAQLASFDFALKEAAKQAEATLENEATIAGHRVANLESVLAQQKTVAGTANTDEVHLRALEQIAQSYKDQLESSMTKYQEALARESSSATPADARVISSAASPQTPSFPKKVPFIVFGTTLALVLAIGFAIAAELVSNGAELAAQSESDAADPVVVPPTVAEPAPSTARRAWSFASETATVEDPVFAPLPSASGVRPKSADTPERAPGSAVAAAWTYLKHFGRSAAAARQAEEDVVFPPRGDAEPTTSGDIKAIKDEPSVDPRSNHRTEGESKIGIARIVDRVVSAHVPGRGLHIVGTGVGPRYGAELLIDLARTLSAKGRAILVDLNRTPERLTPLYSSEEGGGKAGARHGLAELLAGDATFAEVIQKDGGSRLHYISTGLQDADFHDFDLILDALSETYDFVVLMTPDFPQSDIARVMAPYADFVVLSAASSSDEATVGDLRAQMVKAGARDVIVAGIVEPPGRADVA